MDTTEIRVRDCLHVRDIHRAVRIYSKSPLSKSDFDACKIKVKISNIDMDSGTPTDSGPQYGIPYSSQRFDLLFKVTPKVPFPNYRDEGEYYAAYEIFLFLNECLGALKYNRNSKWRRRQ